MFFFGILNVLLKLDELVEVAVVIINYLNLKGSLVESIDMGS